MNTFANASLLVCLAVCTASAVLQDNPDPAAPQDTRPMEFGNFSVSIAVEDLQASLAFYEKLGFRQTHGDVEQNYVILRNASATIGLFQGMFEGNILTFNPGWTRAGEPLEDFTDVRELQALVMEAGITPVTEADPASTGPTSFILADPDGNTIYVDQHVPAPKR